MPIGGSRRRRRRLVVVAAADVSNFETEAAAVCGGCAVIGGGKSHELGVRSGDRGATERASLLRLEPRVDADGVEGVAAEREETELVAGLEFRQADGAVGGYGGGGSASDGGEGEEREGGQGHRIDSASGYAARIRG